MGALLVGLPIVCFVESEDDGHTIGFSGGQEAVDECGGGFGARDSHHQQCLVDIGGEDVALFGEVGGFADDVVAALVNFCDKGGLACGQFVARYRNGDSISHGHRIGRTNAAQAEVTLDAAGHYAPIVCAHFVMAACVADYLAVGGHF